MNCYSRCGNGNQALKLFQEMKDNGIIPDIVFILIN